MEGSAEFFGTKGLVKVRGTINGERAERQTAELWDAHHCAG
jgi:hypothetical protein